MRRRDGRQPVEQGADVLRSRLTRRGFSPAAIGIGLPGLRMVPTASLVGSTASLATNLFGRAVPTSIGLLAQATLKEMLMARILTATVLLLGSLTAAGAILGAVLPVAARTPPEARAVAADEPPKAATPPAPAAPASAKSMRVVVLDPRGQARPGCEGPRQHLDRREGLQGDPRLSDGRRGGGPQSSLPASSTSSGSGPGRSLLSRCSPPGSRTSWQAAASVPPEYTFGLESAVGAGGRIVDEQGKPIVGAKVRRQPVRRSGR